MPMIALALTLSLTAAPVGLRAEEGTTRKPRCDAPTTAAVCRDTPNGIVVGPNEQAVVQAAEEAAMAETARWIESR